jgi:hypothetical protein
MKRQPTGRTAAGNRRRPLVIALALAGAVLPAVPAQAAATIDPSDPRLVPNPIESSDEGTAWTCQVTGSDVQCDGTLVVSWQLQDGPDVCALPLYSVNGVLTRSQTRYYSYDAASGRYLEYKRLVHLYSNEYLTPIPDPDSTNVVIARLSMTWISTFQTPGDLESRSTQKQGIDTFLKRPDGALLVLDVGQKTTVLGEDFDFHGRWDIALGNFEEESGKICTALGM